MKSYQKHLESTQSFGENISLTRKPVFRSSAIFPVLESSAISTKVLFMGYWLKKRHIREVNILISLRDSQGSTILRKSVLVDMVKGYTVSVLGLLAELNYQTDADFVGSIELEVFSTRDLVFPYPAFVVNYFSEYGITSVHTTGRVYNDIEDYIHNNEYKVAESGFDIYSTGNYQPFFCFVNGPYDNSDKPIPYEIIDENQHVFSGTINVGNILPYTSHFVKLKDHIDLDRILSGKKGTIKLYHNFEGFFPRFIGGNFIEDKTVSITHTYYDNSKNTNEDAYFQNNHPDLHDSCVFIPLFTEGDAYTNLIYYPVYSPSEYHVTIIFYDIAGNCVAKLERWKEFKQDDSLFLTIDLKQIISENCTPSQSSIIKGAYVINNWNHKNQIPTRLKYGLNVGLKNRLFDLPTNICFAPQIANPKLLHKPGTFKWAPILNYDDSKVVITNASPLKNYDKSANLSVYFYRDIDDNTISKEVTLKPFAQIIFDNETDELKQFFEGKAGWVTIESDNPFVNAWYFDFNQHGVVAGDHSF